ncbi:type IV conjugative transfer system protein TraE [Rickettsiales endosymbiont of Peranema trichophorum]|uniref:type IV conjugative transfer system protein TraE n=1 Tax=Rickettsiales endosymbiont of Peranema trichophorum TaxID=2486577 RepID=UPI0010231010|nr:type IV conjugative transfer system protein TraE [Rickettsiales endosymbiont of Peranema trichophorum]RZI47503.1 type IV conjugative transfer system protein TraE [Rickettsiales endosymbiont of Peranema trichophorum]
MELFRWNNSIDRLVKQRNGFLVVSLGLLIANMLLSGLLFMKDERIIVVPAYFKQSFWVEGHLVSEAYIEEMSLFFTKMMLDTTPDSHQYRKDVILRYVAPEYYHDLEKRLIADARRMQKEGVSTMFAPKQVEVNTKELKSEVVGTLTQYVAGTRIGQSKERYELTFGYSGGVFMLKGFETKYE